jgi:hypothetical protein
MEPLPISPTQVPQARRYTRKFLPNATKLFQKEDSIVIEIPPIQNTYLTKNARLHFTMNMSFQENSVASTEALIAQFVAGGGTYAQRISNYFQKNLGATALVPTDLMLNMARKPVPMLDTCGPYGFFRKVEVYDYLGNTLLENIDRHDLLAAQMSDFYLDHDTERMRPYITDDFGASVVQIKAPGPGVVPRQSRVNGIPLLDPDGEKFYLTRYQYSPPSAVVVHGGGDVYTVSEGEAYTVQPWEFSIDLLSFLGRGSSKFVPLHNGYRLVFHLNDPNVPIRFGLPNGSMDMDIRYGPSFNPNQVFGWTMSPYITEWNLQAPYLRAELLEITPELDVQVEKVVHAFMRNYVLKGRVDKPTILPGNFLSAKNVTVSFRHIPFNDNHSVVGFRSRNYVKKARLLYNDALQQELGSEEEIRLALGEGFNSTISKKAFVVDKPFPDLFISGSGGYMYPYPTHASRYRLLAPVTTSGGAQAGYEWFQTQGTMQNSLFFKRHNSQDGKFLIKFDLDLLGYGKNQIAGVDLTKTTVKLDFVREDYNDDDDPYETDIFTEYDAIIRIEPGKYSSVSF